ncbi:MAG: hypothetical protein K2Y39_16335 [Candidatus Obscuribacterales bacterium]|nr:hypothetical protein [Candidatus Obscuribacterales bacterium]
MICERRRAWLKDRIHGIFVKKFPNLVRLADLLKKPLRAQLDHLLDENFHDKIENVKRRAFPFMLAYLAGCLAPAHERRDN